MTQFFIPKSYGHLLDLLEEHGTIEIADVEAHRHEIRHTSDGRRLEIRFYKGGGAWSRWAACGIDQLEAQFLIGSPQTTPLSARAG